MSKVRSKKLSRRRPLSEVRVASRARAPLPLDRQDWAFHMEVETCNVCDDKADVFGDGFFDQRRTFMATGNEVDVKCRPTGQAPRYCLRCQANTAHTHWMPEGNRLWWNDRERPGGGA